MKEVTAHGVDRDGRRGGDGSPRLSPRELHELWGGKSSCQRGSSGSAHRRIFTPAAACLGIAFVTSRDTRALY